MVSRVAAKRFTVVLERVQNTATGAVRLEEAFGRARPLVKVTIRGRVWRTRPVCTAEWGTSGSTAR
jgi:hypothetical protein